MPGIKTGVLAQRGVFVRTVVAVPVVAVACYELPRGGRLRSVRWLVPGRSGASVALGSASIAGGGWGCPGHGLLQREALRCQKSESGQERHKSARPSLQLGAQRWTGLIFRIGSWDGGIALSPGSMSRRPVDAASVSEGVDPRRL